MACTRALSAWLAAAAIAAAGTGWAASPCEELRAQTGLAVAPVEGGVAVATVDDDSPAAGSVRTGDVIVQVNGSTPRSCGEYARAVREARKEGRALLLLVRRGGAEVAAAVPSAAWARVAPPPPPLPPPAPPTVRALVVTPPPPPLPPETHVSVEEVTGGLTALATDPPPRVEPYRKTLTRLQRQVETLAARGAAPAPVIAGLRTVLRYYDAAEIAWTAAEDQRQRDRRPRHVPMDEAATAQYFTDSREARVVDEFPFLSATVVREPDAGVLMGESAGLWRPLEARTLLWREGRAEVERLAGWLAAGSAPGSPTGTP